MKSVSAFLLAAWLLVSIGCAAKVPPPPPLPALLPVTGTVKMGGKPLDGAVVIFLTTDVTGAAFNVMGGTDAAGSFKLKTRSGQELHDGAPAGNYKVFISRMVKPDGTPLAPDPKIPPAMVAARESIAAKFSNPNQTTLKATVAAGKESFDFEVAANPLTMGKPAP